MRQGHKHYLTKLHLHHKSVDHDFQTGFKDEDVEAWQPSDIIKAPQLTKQSRNKLWVTLTLGLHS